MYGDAGTRQEEGVCYRGDQGEVWKQKKWGDLTTFKVTTAYGQNCCSLAELATLRFEAGSPVQKAMAGPSFKIS